MNSRRKIIKTIKTTDRNKDKFPLIINKMCESNVKPLEEWLYGKLNRIGSSGIITFKNQTAFNGYDGRKVKLCK
jgi:hypothetical protein